MKMSLIIVSTFFSISLNAQWSQKLSGTSKGLNDVSFPTSSIGFAVGDSSCVIKTIDGGETWTNVALDPMLVNDFESVYFIDNQKGFIGGAEVLLKTNDGGISWSMPEVNHDFFGFPLLVNEIVFTDPLNGFFTAVYEYSGDGFGIPTFSFIFKTNNGGENWEPIYSSDVLQEHKFNSISFPSSDLGFVCDENNIFKTNDAGVTWELIYSEPYPRIYPVVYFFDNNLGFYSGWNFMSKCHRSNDGGSSWLDISGNDPTPMAFRSLAFTDLNNGFAIGGGALIRSTIDGGLNWTDENLILPSELNGYLNKLVITNNAIFVVGDNGVILKKSLDAVGIEENMFSENTEVYPNPTTGTLYISHSFGDQKFNYEVLDLNGKIIDASLINQGGESMIELNLEHAVKGVYLIKLFNEFDSEIIRVVKQ